MLKFKIRHVAMAIAIAIGSPLAYADNGILQVQTIVRNTQTPVQLQAQQLYAKYVVKDGAILQYIATLTEFAQTTSYDRKDRARAALLSAHLWWRHGDLNLAQAMASQSIELQQTADAVLLSARLADAIGETADAIELYKSAATLVTERADKDFIQLRLTLSDSQGQTTALTELAQQRDQPFRNRAALVLALTGHQAEAVELYQINPATGQLFVQHLKLAEWALQAKNLPLAQQHAWLAAQQAGSSYNRRYALAVMLEAYRNADILPQALTVLEGQQGQEIREAYLDLLIELGLYDQAISLLSRDSSTTKEENRDQLIRLYQRANKPDELIGLYQQIIQQQPEQSYGYQGLADFYMKTAQPDQAKQVWQQLIQRNQKNLTILLDAAEAMIKMGLFDEAVGAVEACRTQPKFYQRASFFLFDAYLQAAEEAKAKQVLDQLLQSQTKGQASALKEVADGYERLGLSQQALAIYQQLATEGQGLGYDDQLRLAWLYSVSGEKAKALQVYQDLWLSASSPARRSFVEAQFLLIAAELNQLGDIVVELEDKLIAGAANQNELNLLVRIYIEANDVATAVEVIEEYARTNKLSDVDRLNQLAKVYLVLNDHKGYDQVLRQLIQLEPELKEQHIRSLMMNLLSNQLINDKKAMMAEIQLWLTELKAISGEQVDGEFEANLMTQAGFEDKAIESYRKAIARDPERADNLLLMADLMKGSGKTQQAVALLQYVAEHASSDNEFVVAIDGIINMIGAGGFGDELSAQSVKVFHWVQRIILERIASRNDQFYLYTLLADIAEELSDKERQFMAIENSLPQADIRRLAVLRELVTMASDGEAANGAPRAGDRVRKLNYGRRLVALKQELPPEIFIDLGETLLQNGDLIAAEKAFDMISDITGMLDLDKTKAESFERAGYPAQALVYYSAALTRNQSDLELLSKTAVFREAKGETSIAHMLYWRGLEALLKQQNAESKQHLLAADPQIGQMRDGSLSRDFSKYYEALVQGLLQTWPEDSAAKQLNSLRLNQMLANELTVLKQAQPLKAFSHYTRLYTLSRLIQRIAESTSAPDLAAHLETALAAFFTKDPDYQRLHQSFTKMQPQSDQVVPATSALEQGLQAALAAKDSTVTARYALVLNKKSVLSDLVIEMMQQGLWRDALKSGARLLSTEEFRRVFSARVTAENVQHSLFSIAYDEPELIIQVEQLLGRPLWDQNKLSQLTLRYVSTPQAGSGYGSTAGIERYLQQRLQQDDFVRYAQQKIATTASSSGHKETFKAVLLIPMTESQRQQIAEAARSYLATVDKRSAETIISAFINLMVLDAPSVNHGLIRSLTQEFAQSVKTEVDVVKVVDWYFAGKKQTAFEHLAKSKTWISDYSGSSFFKDYFKSELSSLLAGIRQGELIEDQLAANIAILVDGDLQWLQLLLQNYPKQKDIHRRLLWVLFVNGPDQRFEPALLDYMRKFADEKMPVASLYFYYMLHNKSAEAEQLKASAVEVLSESSLQQIAGSIPQGPSQHQMHWIFQDLAAKVRQKDEKLHPVRKGGTIFQNQQLAKALTDQDDDQAKTLLSEAWRKLRTEDLAWKVNPYTEVLQHDMPDSSSGTLLEMLQSKGFFIAETERLLASLTPEQRLNNYVLYQYLTLAYQRQGKAPDRLRQLEQLVQTDTANQHQFTLYLSLLAGENQTVSEQVLERIRRYSAANTKLHPYQLQHLARIFARHNQVTAAKDYYLAFAVALLPGSADRKTILDLPLSSFTAILTEAKIMLPATDSQSLLVQMIALAEAEASNDWTKAQAAAFALQAVQHYYPVPQRRSILQRWMPDSLQSAGDAAQQSIQHIYLSGLLVQENQLDAAWLQLRGLLQSSATDNVDTRKYDVSQVHYFVRLLGLPAGKLGDSLADSAGFKQLFLHQAYLLDSQPVVWLEFLHQQLLAAQGDPDLEPKRVSRLLEVVSHELTRRAATRR